MSSSWKFVATLKDSHEERAVTEEFRSTPTPSMKLASTCLQAITCTSEHTTAQRRQRQRMISESFKCEVKMRQQIFRSIITVMNSKSTPVNIQNNSMPLLVVDHANAEKRTD